LKHLIVTAAVLLLCAGLCLGFMVSVSGGNGTPEGMRAFPYPYRSMLAICSDIDGTTPREFEDVHKFLNTLDGTEMGPGLGLDVADSFWMYMGSDAAGIADREGNGNEAVMTWFQGTTETVKNAHLIAYYFERGWIDTMHSYGDFSRLDKSDVVFTRMLAERALSALAERDVRPTVWVNHGNEANVQNFEVGNRRTYRQGARPGSDAYHADLTLPAGIKFVWFSDNDRRFGRRDILYPVTLADGQKVWGFRRYTPDWSTYELDRQLREAHLDACVKRELPVIVTQHFGGGYEYQPFGAAARQALQGLAERQNRGDILVARTSRLLEYLRVRDHLEFERSGSHVNILAVDDPQFGYDPNPSLDSLRGMTFYAEDMISAGISIGGEPLPEELLVKAVDETGRTTIGVAWFEADAKNYVWAAAELAR